MKKILLITLTLLFSFNSFSQSKNRKRDYSKYEKAKADQVKYITEKAYWDEFVNSTNGLYNNVKTVQKSTDAIMMVTKVVPTKTPYGRKLKKVRKFYKNGKLIAEYVGKNFIDYDPPKSSIKKKKRKPSSKSLNKTYFKKEKGDRITYISEKDFYKKYLNKKSRSRKKIMVVSRLTSKRKRYLLFYKNKKLIGQFINGKYFDN